MQKQLRMLELMLKVIDPPLFQYFEQTDSSNMFCCFRWLLILFKREFPFEELKTLWEVIWMCPFTKHFHLFIAIAILNHYRQELFECRAFDEILKFINNLSQNIDVPEMIKHAEVLYYVFRDRIVQYGPQEVCALIVTRLTTDTENVLCKVSGIEHSDLVLDDKKVKGMESMSNQEWLELLTVLEITEF
jgi:Rab-GTPase-TBC domain